MINCLKSELKYLVYSKIFLAGLLSLIVIYCIVIYGNYSFAKAAYNDYQQAIEISIEEGADIESELHKEFSIAQTESGLFVSSGVIDNPLAYHYDQFKKMFFAASPKYTLAQMGEVSFLLILPLLFGLIGSFIGSYDLSQKTIKLKGVRASRVHICLSKHISRLGCHNINKKQVV